MNTNNLIPYSADAASGSGCPNKTPKRRMARAPQDAARPQMDQGQLGNIPAAKPAPPRAPSKIASVIVLLDRPEGATLAEMVAATGWLPHTTRAALTGLKKKGHVIAKDKRGNDTCYHIAKAGA